MAEVTDDPSDSRLSTVVALLIAAVSVVGAIVAWRASVLGDAIGGADTGGLRATINLNETRALTALTMYSAYSTFTEYYENRQISTLLESEYDALPETAEDEVAFALAAQLADTRDKTTATQPLFPNQYLNRDGTYALDRMRGSLFADAARQRDLNPTPSFIEGDALRAKSDRLLIALSVLGISLVLYTLIEVIGSYRLKLGLAALGTLAFLIGGIAAFLIDTGRL